MYNLSMEDLKHEQTPGLSEAQEQTEASQPSGIDTTADLEGAMYAVSPERAREVRQRQEDIARRRARSLGSPVLRRKIT